MGPSVGESRTGWIGISLWEKGVGYVNLQPKHKEPGRPILSEKSRGKVLPVILGEGDRTRRTLTAANRGISRVDGQFGDDKLGTDQADAVRSVLGRFQVQKIHMKNVKRKALWHQDHDRGAMKKQQL